MISADRFAPLSSPYFSRSSVIFGFVSALQGQWMVMLVMAAIAGCCLGFLRYNFNPATIFMGDTGSLAIGGVIAVYAIAIRKELLIPILCGIFVVENLSVILQVGSFKLRGQRIFRMAPIHHHYELKGWPEPRVIVRFWIISLMLVLIGLATLKVR